MTPAARRACLAVAIAAAVLAGCGDGGGEAAPVTAPGSSASTAPTTGAAPADLAESVAAATDAAGGARFVLETLAEAGGGTAVASRSEGVVDWVAGRGHRVDSLDETLLTTGSPGGLEPAVELWLVEDRTWQVDVDDPAGEPEAVTGGAGAFLGLRGAGDGDDVAAAVGRVLAGRRFALVGDDEVGGVAATSYRAGPAGEDAPGTVGLWVDGDGRLVRLEVTSAAPTGAELVAVLELSDLGGGLDVPPPPPGIG